MLRHRRVGEGLRLRLREGGEGRALHESHGGVLVVVDAEREDDLASGSSTTNEEMDSRTEVHEAVEFLIRLLVTFNRSLS